MLKREFLGLKISLEIFNNSREIFFTKFKYKVGIENILTYGVKPMIYVNQYGLLIIVDEEDGYISNNLSNQTLTILDDWPSPS